MNKAIEAAAEREATYRAEIAAAAAAEAAYKFIKQQKEAAAERKTIYLSDFEIMKLIKGYSVLKDNVLITFEKGSKRYIE